MLESYNPLRLESNSASGNPIISVIIIILHAYLHFIFILKCEIQTLCLSLQNIQKPTDIYDTSHGPYTIICHNNRVIFKLLPDSKQKRAREKFWRIRNSSATQSRVSSESTTFSNNTQLNWLRHFLLVEYKIRPRQSWKPALLFRKFLYNYQQKELLFFTRSNVIP